MSNILPSCLETSDLTRFSRQWCVLLAVPVSYPSVSSHSHVVQLSSQLSVNSETLALNISLLPCPNIPSQQNVQNATQLLIVPALVVGLLLTLHNRILLCASHFAIVINRLFQHVSYDTSCSDVQNKLVKHAVLLVKAAISVDVFLRSMRRCR